MDASSALADQGNLLIQLGHGVRKSTQLADRLAGNPLVGCEARALLGRLKAIREELDAAAAVQPFLRHAEPSPFWRENRYGSNENEADGGPRANNSRSSPALPSRRLR